MRPWITFFSQTGTEIVDICNELGQVPTLIVTNRNGEELESVNPWLLDYYGDKVITLPNRPTVEEYLDILEYFDNPLITLHGWLRILPKEVCDSYEVVNGHPGLITEYPELKGFNPQEKAFKLKMKESGCVIHEVIPEVDAGPILLSEKISIENLDLNEIYTILRKGSLNLWTEYLKNKL